MTRPAVCPACGTRSDEHTAALYYDDERSYLVLSVQPDTGHLVVPLPAGHRRGFTPRLRCAACGYTWPCGRKVVAA